MTYEFSPVRKDPEFKHFKAHAVSGALGAKLEGLDLTKELSAEAQDEIQQALVHYHVLFIYDQDLTPAEHTRFAKVFGEVQMGGTIPRLEEQPEVKKQEYTQASKVVGDVNMHSDDTFTEMPSRCSILYGLKMPPSGGDTIWVNTEAAYAGLSKPLQEMLEKLNAVHDLSARFGIDKNGDPDHDMRWRIAEKWPAVQHPVIRTHPVSGRKSIYVNEMVTTRIVGLEPEESTLLLDYLFVHLKKPLYQCRLHWRDGTVVVWDNRSTQHVVIPDFQPQYRLNHRVAIKDDVKPAPATAELRSVA